MNILVINPNTSESMTDAIRESARRGAGPGVNVDVVSAARGPRSIEGNLDHCLASVGVLERIAGSIGKYDGYVIACFGDPALEAAREMVDCPVVGIAEAAMHMACFVGSKFSVISVLDRARPTTEELVRKYGLWEKCASIRTTGIAVLDLERDPERAATRLEEEGRIAVQENGAEVLLLGCAGLTGMNERLAKAVGVPALDGVVMAVSLVEMLVRHQIRTSKKAMFMRPEKKGIVGYGSAFDVIYADGPRGDR